MKVAINGYGRIGRCVARVLHRPPWRERLQLVAINDPMRPSMLLALSRRDSVHGLFPVEVSACGDHLRFADELVAVTRVKKPADCAWREHQVDTVFECSGRFATRKALGAHLDAGARRVLLSNPGETSLPVAVRGVNEPQADEPILSCASCTSAAAAPVLALLHERFGVHQGEIVSIHALLGDQPTLDGARPMPRDERCLRAATSVTPVGTELAQGLERVLPQLAGRLGSCAFRVPVPNVSLLDVFVELEKRASVAEINAMFKEAAAGDLNGVVGFSEEPLVSCDFVGDPRSAVIDAERTHVRDERYLKLLLWFDNEWAYANRMVELAAAGGGE